jgi:fluoroquinolone transport system permease protein
MSLPTMLRWDVDLQIRYGFYAVYAVVTVLFSAGLLLVPPGVRTDLLVLVLFGDPGFLGFYFVGALVLFEKNEGVLDALVTSPLSIRAYLTAKVVSLSAIALAGASVVTLVVHGTDFDLLWFLLGLGLTAGLFVLVGFAAVARFDSLNAYFLTAILYLLPLSLPLLDHLDIVSHPLFYLLPTQASLVLLGAAFEPTPTWELAYGVGYLLTASAVAWVLARRRFVRHVVRGEGGGRREQAESAPTDGAVSGLLDRLAVGPITTLAVGDLRNWLRDPLLVYIGLSPLLLAGLGRWGVPAIDAAVSFVDLTAYEPELLAAFLLTPAGTFGFVGGFFILEDREQGVLQALRTTPITGAGYLRYRGLVILGLTAVVTAVTVPVVDFGTLPPATFLAVVLVASLHAAVTALLLAGLALNTVEGVGISKGLGFLIVAPVVTIALVSGPLELVAGVCPPYWAAKAVVLSLSGGSVVAVAGYLAVGTLYQVGLCALLVRQFGRFVG